MAELLDVGGDADGGGEGPLVHFVDWPSAWDQRVAVGSGLICRLLPLRSDSRGYTGPPSLANKEGVKESFERRVAEKMAQQRDEVSGAAARPHSRRSAEGGRGSSFSSCEFLLVSLWVDQSLPKASGSRIQAESDENESGGERTDRGARPCERAAERLAVG